MSSSSVCLRLNALVVSDLGRCSLEAEFILTMAALSGGSMRSFFDGEAKPFLLSSPSARLHSRGSAESFEEGLLNSGRADMGEGSMSGGRKWKVL